MSAICVVKKDTNEIIACIPPEENGKMILHNDYDVKFYEKTEPYFTDIDGKVVLLGNIFGMKLDKE